MTTLFLEYDLPKTAYVSESHNGQLLSGVYQLGARLVTDSGASTVFGISTSVIPVIQDSLQGNRSDINGAPPQTQTTKSITVKVTNIDTAFKYLELAVLTYVGTANTTKVTLMNKILINGRTTIEVTYRGAPDDVEQLLVDELITSGIFYDTGKYLAQKDGSLLIASPKEADLPPIDWFRIAQNMKASYITKDIKYDENLQFEYDYDRDDKESNNIKEVSTQQLGEGYKNPITCTLYKGYRRDEVYGFTLTPVFKTGVYGPTVHIPAMHDVDTDATVIGSSGPPTLATSAEILNLTPGSRDNWSIKAVNSAGDESVISQYITVQLLGGPPQPQNLVASNVTVDNITLNWDPVYPAPGKYIAEYRIYLDEYVLVERILGTPAATTHSITTSFPIQADFHVVAIDNDGLWGEPSAKIHVHQPGAINPLTPPAIIPTAIVNAPYNLVASNIETTKFQLDWDASISPDVVKYVIYQNFDIHSIVEIPGLGAIGTSGELGTFISQETYVDDRYPDIPVGSGLRLHKFPSAKQQPILNGNVTTNDQYIRVLGVEFSGIQLTSEELQYSDLIAGFIIGRLNRNGNETQLAQGLARPICDVRYDQNNSYTKSILLGDGTISWEYLIPPDDEKCSSRPVPPTDSIQFIAPDIIHRLYDPNAASMIKQQALFECNPFAINSRSP